MADKQIPSLDGLIQPKGAPRPDSMPQRADAESPARTLQAALHVLAHDLVPARFDCQRVVFLVNQKRWFKHMHYRDGGSSDISTVAGSIRPVRIWVASPVARVVMEGPPA